MGRQQTTGACGGAVMDEEASSPRIRAGPATDDDGGGIAMPAMPMPLPAPGRVARAIARLRAAQRQRAEDYRRLGALVAFIALLLGVLYAQRGAAAAFRVHSTITSVLGLPDSGAMQSADEVYDWLGGLVAAVWKDPVCGDGLCEAPFEFASYGRFGCRADCGALIDLQRLAAIDIDLYYDFGHPAGSLPAAELVAQAAWNLCPQATAYAAGCYYADDAAFPGVSGEVHLTLRDVPDGTWALRVKRDPLSKVRGAVRLTDGVQLAAVWAKVYVAAAAVAAEQAQELSLLRLAIAAGRTPLLDYLPTLWNVTRASARDAFDAQQMRNATCVCGAGATAALAGTAGFADEASYQAGANCTGVAQLAQRVWYPNGTSAVNMPPSVDATVCAEALANLTTHRQSLNATMLSWLVTQRLGNLATTGKFANRTATIARLRTFLAARRPELVAPIFTQPKGAAGSAQAAPQNATVAELAALYVDSPSLAAGGPPAHLALFRRRLNGDPGMTLTAWADRAAARVAEIAAQQAEVAGLALPVPGAPAAAAVGSVAAAFQAAGANATWLPDPDARELGAFGVRYDLATWSGGPWEFATCRLAQRAPEYAGTCEARTVACGASSVDGVPYACTRLADNATIAGNLSSSAYRGDCELPCDLELDCGALCDCGASGCAAGQLCKCAACVALQGDAAANSEFVTIATAAASSGAAAASFAPVTAAAAGAGRRRRLQATSNDEVAAQLSALSTKLDTLRAAQDAVGGQVDALQRRVDQANALAEARAASTRVQDLIAAGRADIAAGRAALEGKLDSLLGRQQAVLDAARTASTALAAIESMATRQASALASLDAAVKEQVRTISVATQQGLISLSTALSYWKAARRNRAAEEKLYRLANTPCRGDAAVDHKFSVDNGNAAANDTARDRSVGLNNRIIGGVLLHTWRAAREECPKTRFSAVTSSCRAKRAPDLRPYGVDPSFKPGTASFQADLAAPDDGPALALYNCSRVAPGPPAYDVADPATGLVANARPYCAQLFNPRNVPYGFHHFPLPGARAPGFPAWLDINLSQDGAAAWLAWLRDGLLLDGATAGLAATFATYNADLRLWALVEASFEFGDGGLIEAAARVAPLRVELYDRASHADAALFAAEIALSAASCLLALGQVWAILMAALRRGNDGAAEGGGGGGGLRGYFASPAHWVDALSNLLQLGCCALWWLFALRHARAWSMDLRYDVYADLAPAANFLRLADGGRALLAAWAALRGLGAAARLLSWYYAASGVSVLLLLARLLRRMDFQPRLGVITRALRRALPDLLHFALVAGAVFVGYGVTGYLVFGSAVPQFSGLGAALNACFSMVLGDFGDVRAALGQLRGVQGAAGGLFFWTYMLLVFLVLLNFLLAIIVDAFAEVKENTRESTGIVAELAQLAAGAWRGLAGRLLPGGRARAAQRKLDALLEGWARPATGGDCDGGGDRPAAGGGAGAAARRSGPRAAARALAVDGRLLDEPALAAALCASLAQFDAADGGGEKSKGGGGNNAAGAGGISAEEAAAVARYALARYGAAAAGTDGSALAPPGSYGGASMEAAAAAAANDGGRLAGALERLAAAQSELAQSQRALLAGQRALAEQQRQLAGGGAI